MKKSYVRILDILNQNIIWEEDREYIEQQINKIKEKEIKDLIYKILDIRHQIFMIDMADHWEESDFRESSRLNNELMIQLDELRKEMQKDENT